MTKYFIHTVAMCVMGVAAIGVAVWGLITGGLQPKDVTHFSNLGMFLLFVAGPIFCLLEFGANRADRKAAERRAVRTSLSRYL